MPRLDYAKGDRLRVPYVQLVDDKNNPINLTGQSVYFRMVDTKTGAVKISSAAAVVVDAAQGKVRYDWTANDVDTPASYLAWFIRDSGGLKEHFPVDQSLFIHIHDDNKTPA